MKNRFAIAGFVVCAVLTTGALQTAIAQARQSESHRWEYCALTDSYGTGTREKPFGIAVVTYFENAGERAEYIRVDLETSRETLGRFDLAQKKAFAKALAKLGDDEWELIGGAPSPYVKLSTPAATDGVAIFFKRPKRL